MLWWNHGRAEQDWLTFAAAFGLFMYFWLNLCSCSSFCVSVSDSDSLCLCPPVLLLNVSFLECLFKNSFVATFLKQVSCFLASSSSSPALPFFSHHFVYFLFIFVSCSFSPSVCLQPFVNSFSAFLFVLPFPLPFYLRLFFTINYIRDESLNFGSIYKM